MKIIGKLLVLGLLVACAPWAKLPDLQTLIIESEPAGLTLKIPKGYCFDEPALIRRRGDVQANDQIFEALASNCDLATQKPSTLTHLISFSASPARTTLEAQAQNMAKTLDVRLHENSEGYMFSSFNDGYSTQNQILSLNGFIVLIGVTKIADNDIQSSQTLINSIVQETRQAN